MNFDAFFNGTSDSSLKPSSRFFTVSLEFVISVYAVFGLCCMTRILLGFDEVAWFLFALLFMLLFLGYDFSLKKTPIKNNKYWLYIFWSFYVISQVFFEQKTRPFLLYIFPFFILITFLLEHPDRKKILQALASLFLVSPCVYLFVCFAKEMQASTKAYSHLSSFFAFPPLYYFVMKNTKTGDLERLALVILFVMVLGYSLIKFIFI